MPSTSILIVGYHADEELDRCLASLAVHEPEAEVIVVEHDADANRGRALADRHPHVIYVPRRENPGFGAGVNHAATHAHCAAVAARSIPTSNCARRWSGRLAARLEIDHERGRWSADGFARRTVRSSTSARRFPDLSTAFGGRTSWLTRVSPGNPLTRRNLSSGVAGDRAVTVDWVTGAFMMIRADVFRALGGFDERFFMYWEDSDLCLRAHRAGWKIVYEPGVEVLHLTGRSSRHAPLRSLLAFHVSAFRHYWKHGSWLAASGRACRGSGARDTTGDQAACAQTTRVSRACAGRGAIA